MRTSKAIESSEPDLLAQRLVFNIALLGEICRKAILRPVACCKHCLMEVDIFQYSLLGLVTGTALVATAALGQSIYYSSQ